MQYSEWFLVVKNADFNLFNLLSYLTFYDLQDLYISFVLEAVFLFFSSLLFFRR
jgi:hypothetical protein